MLNSHDTSCDPHEVNLSDSSDTEDSDDAKERNASRNTSTRRSTSVRSFKAARVALVDAVRHKFLICRLGDHRDIRQMHHLVTAGTLSYGTTVRLICIAHTMGPDVIKWFRWALDDRGVLDVEAPEWQDLLLCARIAWDASDCPQFMRNWRPAKIAARFDGAFLTGPDATARLSDFGVRQAILSVEKLRPDERTVTEMYQRLNGPLEFGSGYWGVHLCRTLCHFIGSPGVSPADWSILKTMKGTRNGLEALSLLGYRDAAAFASEHGIGMLDLTALACQGMRWRGCSAPTRETGWDCVPPDESPIVPTLACTIARDGKPCYIDPCYMVSEKCRGMFRTCTMHKYIIFNNCLMQAGFIQFVINVSHKNTTPYETLWQVWNVCTVNGIVSSCLGSYRIWR